MRKLALAAVALLAFSLDAAAQFPNKPIRIIVPYQAGGTSEVMARAVGDQLTAAWKQPVVIENRPGGGTTIGAALVAQAPADGYTIFVNASSFLINAHLMSKLPYDPQKDFMPLTLAASNPHLLVVFPGLGIPTLDGLGPIGEGAHAAHESIVVDRMVDRTALITELLRTL